MQNGIAAALKNADLDSASDLSDISSQCFIANSRVKSGTK